MRVRVHQNLRTKRWTITALEGSRKGYKVGDADSVTLADVAFVVSEARRQWTIRHKARQVHAWAEGTLVDTQPLPSVATRVTYNPFRAGYFHMAGHVDVIVRNAQRAYFTADQKAYVSCA